jgi:multidrug resistance efflux pump
MITLGIVAAVGAIGFWFVRPMFFGGAEDATYLMDRVKSGVFTHDVIERGEMESSSNVEVRCQVQSRTSSGTSIIEIVPEGTLVAEGDFLIRLDDSALKDELTQQQNVVNASEAKVIESKAGLATAQISKEEYEFGTFKQDEELLRSEAFVAEEDLRRAQEYAMHSEKLAAKGYVTQVQLEADRFAVKKAEADLALANTKLKVLREYTKRRTLEQLNSDIAIADAKLKADEKTLGIDQNKLELVKDLIEKCVIKAPSDGQVVYANESGGRNGQDVIIQEGTVVRERQVIVRLPDPTKMQVKARVNESRIDFVRAGLPVVIHIDALPGTELQGIVRRVSDYPMSGGFFGSSVKEYATYVEVVDSPKGLRPGMTAEVSIRVDQAENALQLPVQAVFERGGRRFCLTNGPGGLAPTEIKIGANNDKFVVIQSGLKQDQEVLSNPRKYLHLVDLPAAAEGDDKKMLAALPPKPDGEQKPRSAAGGGKGGKGGKGGAPGDIAGMIRGLDTNKDGKVDAAEMESLPDQFKTRLKEADTNSDGALDSKELNVVVQAIAARMGGAGGGRPGGNAGGAGGGGGAAP